MRGRRGGRRAATAPSPSGGRRTYASAIRKETSGRPKRGCLIVTPSERRGAVWPSYSRTGLTGYSRGQVTSCSIATSPCQVLRLRGRPCGPRRLRRTWSFGSAGRSTFVFKGGSTRSSTKRSGHGVASFLSGLCGSTAIFSPSPVLNALVCGLYASTNRRRKD